MGRVWCWMFFSRGLQHAFSSKISNKALDHDLGFVQCHIWDNMHTFYVHVIVANFLCLKINNAETKQLNVAAYA